MMMELIVYSAIMFGTGFALGWFIKGALKQIGLIKG